MGGSRQDLQIKLVGGGRVLPDMSTDIGERNIAFVRRFIENEGYQVLGEDLGDRFARRVVYFPQSGRMRVRKLMPGRDENFAVQERAYLRHLDSAPIEGDIELF